MRPPPDCKHIDNWRNCKLHQSFWQRWFGIDIRPHCILDRLDDPRDGKWECPDYDQLPRSRPPPPGTFTPKIRHNVTLEELIENRQEDLRKRRKRK